MSHNYILSVVAFDCGQKKSEPLLVTIEVKKACSTGWTGKNTRDLSASDIRQYQLNIVSGLPRVISYVPGTGPQALFGDAALSICQKTSCEPKAIEV